MRKIVRVLSILASLACLTAGAEVLDRADGIRIGERMTLRPYVSLSATYDSNVGGRSGGTDGDFMWTISPGFGLSYNAENWSLLLTGFYNYHSYLKSENRDYGQHTFGEDLRWNWANSTGAEKGWSLILGQSFQQVSRLDDITTDSGSNYGGNSHQFQLSGALQRRFNEHWHGDVNASYYWLEYDQNGNDTASFYGWSRYLVGAEAGFAPSQWTDLIVSGSYQGYEQDNAQGDIVGGNSTGYSLQAGLGSYMTDRISYRALAGWSRFDYGDGASSSDGFVYTLSGNWKIGETWNTMLLATSYYQPSERQQSSQSRVDALSWGLAKSMVRGKLRATLDLRYRRETHEYVSDSSYDYVMNIWTGRIGMDYRFNRFLACFAYAEYQDSSNSEGDRRNGAYDYDRWRVTVGARVSY